MSSAESCIMHGPASASAPDVRDWVSANVEYDHKIREPATAMTPGITDIVREHLATLPYHWQFMKSKRDEIKASCIAKVREQYQPPASVMAQYQPAGSFPVGAEPEDQPIGPVRFIFLVPILIAIVQAIVGKIFGMLWDKWFSKNDGAHSQLAQCCGYTPPASTDNLPDSANPPAS